MPKSERRAEDDRRTPAGGGATLRTPGRGSDSSSAGASLPPDAPTLAELREPTSDSHSAAHGLPVPLATASQESYALPPILQPGSILGQRYEILELLGQGGMGAVYKIKDRQVNQLLALKVIRPDLANNPATIDRFKQELILARQVTHKNVIRIHDLAEADGMKFITMEYIVGEDLRSLIWRKRKLLPEEAVEIVRQVCLALEAAHVVGVIHRDLKPQNVMRDTTGRVVVMDFGLARTLEGAGMTQTGALVGTVEYMSPEQALAKNLDQRSDLFAVGLIFYELLTGKMPYTADSALASLIKRTQEQAVPVSDLDSSIPDTVSSIVSKCLERDPDLRYRNAGEILADLESWRGKGAASLFPRVEPRTAAAKHSTRAFPWRVLGSIVVVVALVLTTFLLRHKIFPPTAKQADTGPVVSLAILPFRNASGDSSLDWLGSSMEEMLTTDVGQSSSLRTVSYDRLSQVLSDLHITSASTLDASSVRRLAEFSNADMVVWGQYVKFGDQVRIDATLQDLKHERSVTLKAESSSQKDLLDAIDRLAHSIRENLALSPQLVKELQQQSFKPSSKSLDALRFYNDGVELVRKGDNQEALRRFQESVKADPGFALAYSKLGQTYAKLGYDNEAEQASRRAIDLSRGLPTREKYLISANQARIANDNAKAIEAYENLTKVSPDDPDLVFELASLYSATGAFDKARERFNKVLEHDPKNMEALLEMGRLEIRSDNSRTGLDYLTRALNLAIQLDNQEERAAILHAMGVAYSALNKQEDATRYLQDSLAIKRRLGQKRGIALSLNQLAQVQDTLGKPQAALASYQEAFQLRRDIGDTKGVGDTLIDLGSHYVDRGQYDEALKLFKESLQIQVDVGNEDNQALCLNNIGNAYLSKGDYDNARTYFEQALQLRQKFEVPSDTAETLHNLAETSTKLGQFDKALEQYLQALNLYRTADDKRGAAIESYSMGTVFEYQGRYGAAVSSKRDALKTFRDLQDRSFWMAEILSGYGHALAQAGRGEEAQQNFDEALSLARELQNQSLIAQTLNFEGDSFFYRGEFQSAHHLYDQALQAASHSTDQHLVLLSKLSLSKVAVKEGNPRSAVAALKSLVRDADALGLKYVSLEASLYLAEAQLDMKNHFRARQDLERTLAKSDKLGLRALTAETEYLLGTALRLTGSTNEAEAHYKETVRLLNEIRKEAGGEKLLQRSDLNSIYNESTRWSTSSQT